MQIRTAKPEDALSIITLINNVYGWEADLKKERWKSWENKVSLEHSCYRILEDRDTVIGVCYAGWRNLNFGNRKLRMGELGEICIE